MAAWHEYPLEINSLFLPYFYKEFHKFVFHLSPFITARLLIILGTT